MSAPEARGYAMEGSETGHNVAGRLPQDGSSTRRMPFALVALTGTAVVWLAGYGVANYNARSVAQQTRAVARPEYVTADSRRRVIESLYRPELIGGMVRTNDLPAIRRWITKYPADKGAFFGAAISEGKPDILTFLLSIGFRPNNELVVYRDGLNRERSQRRLQLALARACAGGSPEVVRQLMALGTSANGSDTIGCPILALAASRGHADVVRVLLERGAPVDSAADTAPTGSGTDSDSSPADMERARFLSGKTALHFAAEYHHPQVVKLLLARGADPRRLTPAGETPLQLCRAANPRVRGIGRMEEVHHIGGSSPQAEVESLLRNAIR
jgi:hypothetical protein